MNVARWRRPARPMRRTRCASLSRSYISALAAWRMKPDGEGLAGSGIDEALIRLHPVRSRRAIERLAFVAACPEEEPDQRDKRHATEPDRERDHGRGSMTAAVP